MAASSNVKRQGSIELVTAGAVELFVTYSLTSVRKYKKSVWLLRTWINRKSQITGSKSQINPKLQYLNSQYTSESLFENLETNRYRDRNRKATGLEKRQTECLPTCERRRSAGYGIEKIDFDTDSDPDKTIIRQAMCPTLILRAGNA